MVVVVLLLLLMKKNDDVSGKTKGRFDCAVVLLLLLPQLVFSKKPLSLLLWKRYVVVGGEWVALRK